MRKECSNTLGNMISNFGQVTDLTDHGKCTGGGGCCGNILPLSIKEINVIKHYIKTHNIKENSRVLNVFAEKPMMDMTCPFLSNRETKRCDIYEVRPEICRRFKCDKNMLQEDFEGWLNFGLTHKNTNVRSTFFSN